MGAHLHLYHFQATVKFFYVVLPKPFRKFLQCALESQKSEKL